MPEDLIAGAVCRHLWPRAQRLGRSSRPGMLRLSMAESCDLLHAPHIPCCMPMGPAAVAWWIAAGLGKSVQHLQ